MHDLCGDTDFESVQTVWYYMFSILLQ